MNGVGDRDHDLWLFPLEVKLGLLGLGCTLFRLEFRLPPPLLFFRSLALSSRLHICHFRLSPLVPLSSLQLGLSLFERDSSLSFCFARVSIGSRSGQVGVGIGSTGGRGPVV